MPTCILCGNPITEQDLEDGNYCDTGTIEAHDSCLNEWQDEADARRGDEEYDRSIDT